MLLDKALVFIMLHQQSMEKKWDMQLTTVGSTVIQGAQPELQQLANFVSPHASNSRSRLNVSTGFVLQAQRWSLSSMIASPLRNVYWKLEETRITTKMTKLSSLLKTRCAEKFHRVRACFRSPDFYLAGMCSSCVRLRQGCR
jgi:hypothetical protein